MVMEYFSNTRASFMKKLLKLLDNYEEFEILEYNYVEKLSYILYRQ